MSALEDGVTKDEGIEIITHLAIYAGPPAMTALQIARKVFDEAGRRAWWDAPRDGLGSLAANSPGHWNDGFPFRRPSDSQ